MRCVKCQVLCTNFVQTRFQSNQLDPEMAEMEFELTHRAHVTFALLLGHRLCNTRERAGNSFEYRSESRTNMAKTFFQKKKILFIIGNLMT